MLNKTVQSYGAPYLDDQPVENAQTEQSADLGNRVFEDVAQMTRTSKKAYLKFATTTAGAPVSVTVHADSHTQWGSSSFYFPTLQKTATGTYVATYATTYADALVGGPSNAVSETETVALKWGKGAVQGSAFGHVQLSFAGPVVTIYVFNSSFALNDLGGSVTVDCEFR